MIPNTGGVYQVRNILNDHTYIGSAVNLYRRKGEHFWKLNRETHDNIYLQRSYNKHGKDNFVFELLLLCDKNDLLLYEQMCLDIFEPDYNICLTAGNCAGRPISDETRKKIGDASRGRRHTQETKDRIVESRKWYKHHSAETRKKISDKSKGRKPSDEARRKMSESHKGQLPGTTKHWNNIKAPDGTVYMNVFGMNEFAKKHGINSNCMRRVLNGIRPQHKGWTKA